MRGPRKIDGTFQLNPENVRIIRCYMEGNGTAKQAVAINFGTTTNGLYHAIAADSDTAAHKATIAGVALEAWTCDTDGVGGDDGEEHAEDDHDEEVAKPLLVGVLLVGAARAGA